jgi:RNA polymerase sigma-70 factor (ECF subfamily)
MTEDPAAAADQVFRAERAAVLATLIRHVGDFQVAEDALQDAFESALATWPRDGVPRNPAGWITVTARRRAIEPAAPRPFGGRSRGQAGRTDPAGPAAAPHRERGEHDR